MKLTMFWRKWTRRWRDLNLTLLRFFIRLVPAESHRVFAVALVAGGLCGLAAVSFHLAIIWAESRVIERAFSAAGRTWIWWTILIPTAGGLICGAIMRYGIPGARGSGVPQVKVAYAVRGGRVTAQRACDADVVRAHARAAMNEGDADRTESPSPS